MREPGWVVLNPRAQLRQLRPGRDDCADDPEQRQEDPEDEHHPVPLAQTAKPEHEEQQEVEEDPDPADEPPHSASFTVCQMTREAQPRLSRPASSLLGDQPPSTRRTCVITSWPAK